jgi:hypothetical protein
MKNRDFTYKGIKFHLNDNWNGANREYEGKYWLMWWNEPYERWQSLITVDTKKEAENTVREFYKAKCRCYAY